MAWNATVEEARTVAEGEFDAEVSDVQESNGPTVRIEFKLATEDEWDGRHVTRLASKKLSAATILGRWVKVILGHMPSVGEEVTAEHLLKKHCRVEIKHKTSLDGKTTFANVVDVLSSDVPF